MDDTITDEMIKNYPITQYFRYLHLPENLQKTSRPFAQLAAKMTEKCPRGPEVSAGLRKLLEAKDCFVRAMIDLSTGMADA
jgi:hypothetical protein